MAYENMAIFTHKQLATIVNNPEVGPQDDRRDWARYYALIKKPWKPIPEVKKRKEHKSKERS